MACRCQCQPALFSLARSDYFRAAQPKEKNVASEDTVETVAIIGAGIGGIYLAAELGVAGFKLRLHDIDDARLADIRAFGGIDVEGERGGFAAVEHATSDLREAVDGADVIIIVTGGNAQAAVARLLAPLLDDGQIILLVQGNTGGSLIVRRALDAAGCRAEVAVARWTITPIRAGGSHLCESGRSSPSAGCRSPRSPAIALQRCIRVCRDCFRERLLRAMRFTPGSPMPMLCCT
jgi:threonine dehydrogenase-like Zn-dependent dehydrogenase